MTEIYNCMQRLQSREKCHRMTFSRIHQTMLGLPTVTSFNKGHMENRYKHNFQSHLYHYIYASVACGDL